MKNRVITISREFGSGGRTIGKKVAEKLGIPCYDAEIIQEMAKEAPPTRTFSGSTSTRSSRTLPPKAPASSWAAARTTFCRTRRTA